MASQLARYSQGIQSEVWTHTLNADWIQTDGKHYNPMNIPNFHKFLEFINLQDQHRAYLH